MSAFIRTIRGKIAAINHANKELALFPEQVLSGNAQELKSNLFLDQNVRITNMTNTSLKLEALKEGQKVEVGYTQNKSKRTVVYIVIVVS